MFKLQAKLTIALVLLLAALVAGGVLGYRIGTPDVQEESLTSQYILSAIQDQGFLVSQSYVYRGQVQIDKSTGSKFKDFFFGQEIIARGDVKVASGVDVASITQEDVTVTDDGITVRIPATKIFSTELLGAIEVENTQGVIKRVLDNEDGYNEALAALKSEAQAAAAAPELVLDANESAVRELTRLLQMIDVTKEVSVLVDG